MYLLQSVTSASGWRSSRVLFFFPVMWLISTLYMPWLASLPPAAAPEQSLPPTLSLGGLAPTAKSNKYSIFGHRQYLWQGWTTTNVLFLFSLQTKQPSVNTKGRLQFYCYIRMLWHHNMLPASAASSLDINNTCRSTRWQQYAFLITQLQSSGMWACCKMHKLTTKRCTLVLSQAE